MKHLLGWHANKKQQMLSHDIWTLLSQLQGRSVGADGRSSDTPVMVNIAVQSNMRHATTLLDIFQSVNSLTKAYL